jgi:hypothetical protein
LTAPLDHTTYEAWLLDRAEGNLTPQQERELDAFLAQHPHLAPDDAALPTLPVIKAALGALDKETLKRSIPPVGLVSDSTVEDHLIARLEGDLDGEQLDALRAYLIAHPEWQQAERIVALTKLVPEAIAFGAQRDVQRHFPPLGAPTLHTLDDHLIARLEGDLSVEQEQELDRFLRQNEALERNWALVQATRIEAPPVRFAGKEALKKREGRVIPILGGSWYVRMAAAASITALIAVGLWYLRSPDGVEERFARVPTTPDKVELETEGNTKAETAPTTETQGARATGTSLNDAGVPSDDRSGPAKPVNSEQEPMASPGSAGPIPPQPSRIDGDPLMAQEHPPTKDDPRVPEPEQAPALGSEQLATVEGSLDRSVPIVEENERTLGSVLTGALRERVLDTPERSAVPLDGEDAVAAVDRTLKVVGGAHAGLDLERKAKGGINGFHLRLGRNLSISASR